jgi:predicted nuclease with RNAse H fold
MASVWSSTAFLLAWIFLWISRRWRSPRGCSLSIGSDAHARSHLLNLLYGDLLVQKLGSESFMNSLSYDELRSRIAESRAMRSKLSRSRVANGQIQLDFGDPTPLSPKRLRGRLEPPQCVPAGSKVVGIDLTAGNKATGIAKLDGHIVETTSLVTDGEIVSYIKQHKPKIISIDSPLGLPGGGTEIDPGAGIVRIAEQDLASIGIPAYPALIDSMQNLTLRGIKLRRIISGLSYKPLVIESYPGGCPGHPIHSPQATGLGSTARRTQPTRAKRGQG